ncbi:protein kinase [Chroococcidiopsis sp. CCMEE 29]|uniref:protein kinase domain-containing protein n=1 Tax=Chroococcidiopsis sp. CCMEE 29 TaxID=155894 RepID=UPI0020202C34|nr:protein kinase [Chroococcidiopsis sp. CCMEE 29]
MVTLSLLHPQQTTLLQQWQFENESVIWIGRAPDNQVVLDNPLVSRRHLELRRITAKKGNAWQLINQGTNGTFLDGILVSQSLVADGSLIQLAKGGPTLKFQLDSASPRVSTPGYPSPTKTCTHIGNSPNNLFCIHCGQPLLVQRTVRQYQLLRTLGQGGMGTTYLALNQAGVLANPQLLVLKEMNADMAKVAKAQELFEREAHTLKTLNHPGIPNYYDFFVDSGKKYLAMELIHGQDLEKRVNQRGPVTPSQAITWMIQTCDVLDYIHSQTPPLIHRDIKPANLMVRTLDNRVVVLDFGAVKEIGTAFGTRIGAEGYSAPEQAQGKPLTQSDLYAIGPTLIFLLTGETPFKFYRQRGKGYRFQLENVPTITPQLRMVIEQVTEANPGDRYATAKELASALAACQYY